MRACAWAASALFSLMLFGLIAATGVAQNQPGSSPMSGSDSQRGTIAAPAVASSLKITFGSQSAEWTPSTLAALPHTTITAYNEHAQANQTFSGVPLIDLLMKLGVPDKPRGKQLRLYVVAEGSDGYEAVYALAEVTPDIHNAVVIVADNGDGKPLSSDGPLRLVATGEKRPARWVRNLVAIRVMTAE